MWAKTLPVVAVLLEAGADVKVVDSGGVTPLHCAVYWPSVDTIVALLDAGADINAQDNEGKTPLIYVVRDKDANPEVVSFLLDKGADVNIKDNDGKRAVDYARTNRKLAGPVLRRLVKESRQ